MINKISQDKNGEIIGSHEWNGGIPNLNNNEIKNNNDK